MSSRSPATSRVGAVIRAATSVTWALSEASNPSLAVAGEAKFEK